MGILELQEVGAYPEEVVLSTMPLRPAALLGLDADSYDLGVLEFLDQR